MKHYQILKKNLIDNQRTRLVTGFIGSNLAEELLKLNQKLIALDNFATGHRYNLEQVKQAVAKEQWENFTFVKGDMTDFSICYSITKYVDVVLHQVAFASVSGFESNVKNLNVPKPIYRDFRVGDIRHSNVNIDKVKNSIGYNSTHTLEEWLVELVKWYINAVKGRDNAK